jgi:Helicase HerA, central domain/WhiA C-terminal HTH domain
MADEERIENQGERALPSLQSIAHQGVTRGQVGLTGGTFLLAGVADLAMHGGVTGLFFGGLITFVIARHSGQIIDQGDLLLDALVPGRNATQVLDVTARAANAIAPAPAFEEEDEYRDQSVRAKLGRLFGFARRTVVQDGESLEEEPSQDAQVADAPPGSVERLFPMYSEEETLRLGRVAATGQRFDPHFNDLLGNGLIISAVQGAGKSILNGVIIERAGRCGLPVVVLDHKGEYDSVTELPFMNGFRVGSGEGDFHLTPENVDEFVRQVMENRSQAIVNLPSYGDSWVARAKIVAAVGKALMRYAAQQRRAHQLLLPCLVIVDEAQLYLPQNVQLLPSEAQDNKAVLGDLNNAYFSLVSNGRSNGYTMCFATQSLTFIAKWAIKSCQIKVFMRHAEKNDLDECERIINPAVAKREQIERFPKGRGVVFGFTDQPVVVQFDKKISRDVSQTPMIDRLRLPRQACPIVPPLATRLTNPTQSQEQQAEQMTAAIAKSMTLDQLLASVNHLQDARDQETDDRLYEQSSPYPDDSVEETPASVVPPPPARNRRALSPELEATLQARRQHPEMSLRQLGTILGVNKDTVGKRLEILRGFGYRV